MTGTLQAMPLAGSMRRPLIWLAAITLPVPLLMLAFAGLLVPKDAPRIMIAIPIVAFLLGFGWVLRMMRRASVMLDGDALIVNAGIATRRFTFDELRGGGVRVLSLDAHAELRPVLRTWGIGLPGFAAGWFRLRNGDKAFCVLTGRERVTSLRAGGGVRLLLSLADPSPLERALGARRSSSI